MELLLSIINKGKTLYSNCIAKEEIEHVVNLNQKLGEELFLAGENEAYIVNPSEDMLNKFTFLMCL